MPLYEYECNACHRRTEKIQKYSAAELTVCPHCRGRLERTITAAAISFKGGGWFKDGYASHIPATSSEGSASDSGGGGSDSGSSDNGGSSSNVESSATLSANSGDGAKSGGGGGGKSNGSAKPAESSKPAPASPAPAPSSAAKD
jgi:putative FmdB family regulatory protein